MLFIIVKNLVKYVVTGETKIVPVCMQHWVNLIGTAEKILNTEI